MLFSLASGAAVHVQPVGMSSAAWVGVVQTIITAVFGSGVIYGMARGLALLWKMWNESKKLDADGAAAVRKEMMDLNDRQNQRISLLEKDLRDERKRCDDETDAIRKAHGEEMASLRKLHADEIRELHTRIEGLHRQMVQMQKYQTPESARTMNAPTTTARMGSDTQGIGEVLKQTYGIPGVGEGK